MAIHYNLTLLYDKFDIDSEELKQEIFQFINDTPKLFEEINSLIESKEKKVLQEKATVLTKILTDFGVIHAHDTGDLLIEWTKKKAKKKEAFTLINILYKHYKLARKEIKKDYKTVLENFKIVKI